MKALPGSLLSLLFQSNPRRSRKIPLLAVAFLMSWAGMSWATTAPIGLWHLDETSGSTAADSSSNGRTITLFGGYTHIAGHLNDALSFDGSTGYGTTSSWGQLTLNAARSISLWFKTTSTADSAWVSWGASGTGKLAEVGIRSGDIQYYDGANSHCEITASSYCNGQWHHLAFTYNPTLYTMEIYIDGVLKKGASVSSQSTSSSQLFLAQSAAGGAFFNGSLDEVAIYDRTITSTEVATLSGFGSYPVQVVSVLSPAYGSDVSGNTTISVAAPGLTSATAKCWQSGGTFGSDSTVATFSLSGTNGTGSFTFPAASYPHGPLTVRITGTNGSVSDTCYLQLYNTGGTSWNEGIPSSDPPAAVSAGLTLAYEDDFTSMPTISPGGVGKTYASSKPGGGNFGTLPFTDVGSPNNPFLQRDTYLRIRANQNTNATGFLSSLHSDGSGFSITQPCYFECRFIAQDAPGTWPAFWTLTYNGSNFSGPIDEEDIIEAYGGDSGGSAKSPLGYNVTSHQWNQVGLPAGDGISETVNMGTTGGDAGWAYTPHVYGMLVGPSTTTYYLDNIEIGSKTTSPVSLTDSFWFMFDLATGGGWPTDLSRYGGTADMYIDYVRIYGMPDSLPSPWVNQDLGKVGVAGSSSYLNGTFTLNGSGTTIASINDSGQFAYQTMTGDGSITARVVTQQNTNGWAKAGVMIRNSLTADNMSADMIMTPSYGLHFYYRTTAGAPQAGPPGPAVRRPIG